MIPMAVYFHIQIGISFITLSSKNETFSIDYPTIISLGQTFSHRSCLFSFELFLHYTPLSVLSPALHLICFSSKTGKKLELSKCSSSY
ncbi:Homeobox protein HOY1 [Fusarium oxysporum f. sp. albedinis]|nr:Homeobox protein HOY1 [Fusarium oxysporum f. sp. albedinis]